MTYELPNINMDGSLIDAPATNLQETVKPSNNWELVPMDDGYDYQGNKEKGIVRVFVADLAKL